MTKTERINEIVTSMKSFSKEAYHKTEILPELLQLQRELIELVFDEEHAANGNLKIWDVEKHLEQLSEANGFAAAEELAKFEAGCKEICNSIKAEISGNWGEDKAFQGLETMRCPRRVIRNIELTADDVRTELDGVVITSKAIYIVEVKNTKKNIFIDEEGNYYRTGDYMRLDSNIGEKMYNKISLLRRVLESAGLPEIKIESLVVFTNNRMEVNNKYAGLRTCFLGQLPYIVEEYKGRDIYSEADIESLSKAIEEVRCKEIYPYDFDVNQFKMDFAKVMTALEEAASDASYDVEVEDVENKVNETQKVVKKSWFSGVLSKVFTEKTVRYASTAALVTLAVISTATAVSKHNEGRMNNG